MLEALLEVIDFALDATKRAIADPLDRKRIRRFCETRSFRVRSIEWTPLESGWMSRWFDRFYVVRYDDASGTSHVFTCRTNSRGTVEMTTRGNRRESP